MLRSRCVLPLLLLVLPLSAQTPQKAESLREWVNRRQARHAYGVYLQNSKIGWFIHDFRPGKKDGKEVAIETEDFYIEIRREGVKNTTAIQTVTWYELTGDGPVLALEQKIRQGQREVKSVVERTDKGMRVTTSLGEEKTTRDLPAPKKTLALQRQLEKWLAGMRKKGDTFESWNVALDIDDFNVKETVTWKSRQKIPWGGVATDVHEVEIHLQNVKFDARILDDGQPLVGKIGGLLELKAEKETLAKKLDGKSVDLTFSSWVEVEKDLGDPETITYLRLEVKGFGDFKLPTSHRQKVRQKQGEEDVHIVELTRDGRAQTEAPLTKEQRARFLRATSSIQSDAPAIRDLARKIVGEEKDPIRMAEKLQAWVHDNLRQTLGANATTALEVLKNRAGDCTEHTLLFVALARAAGLPAREVTGVAFVNVGKPAFGWHAWAQVHDGKQWVSVDPTWKQVYVDATHVQFADDVQDFAWINVLGKLKFKVVEFRKK